MDFVKPINERLKSFFFTTRGIRIIICTLAFIILLNLIFPFPWFTKTSRIGTFSSEPGISISPNGDKMLIFQGFVNGNRNITLYNIETKTKTKLNSYKAKENIESKFMGWYDNERFLIKEENKDAVNYLLTKDFNNYELLYTIPTVGVKEAYGDGFLIKHAFEQLSPNGRKLVLQDEKDQKLILYENGSEVWSSDKYYDRLITGWSDNEKYAIITEKVSIPLLWSKDGKSFTEIKTPDLEGLYLLDTEEKTINTLKLEIAKIFNKRDTEAWIPNSSIVAFRVYNHTRNESEMGIYTLDLEKQVLTKLNTPDLPPYKVGDLDWSYDFPLHIIEDLEWSPDGRYLAIIAMDSIYTYDTQAKENPLKLQFKVNENKTNADTSINSNQIQWAKDSKKILFTIRKTTQNFLKPADYYVAKVDINSGAVKKRFIRASLHDDLFIWLNENEVIYTQNGYKLYRTKLIW